MNDFRDKVAVVTGAGSGIGRATALALARAGGRVAVTDVQQESAEDTAARIRDSGHQALAFRMDVTSVNQIWQVQEQITSSFGVPSVLVNNAGIAVGGYFLDTGLESWERVVAINLMGVVHCCRAFVPQMVAAERPGHVVNIASMLGYTPAQGVTAYGTTKFGVLGFSESLRIELAPHGIGVTAICPGLIRTNIIQSGVLELGEQDVEEKRRAIDSIYRKRNYPPEKVAAAIMQAIRRNRAVVPVAPEAWLAYYLKRWAPWLVRWIAGKVDI